jgi:hypothetical protein
MSSQKINNNKKVVCWTKFKAAGPLQDWGKGFGWGGGGGGGFGEGAGGTMLPTLEEIILQAQPRISAV